jgi:hypothetical protein
MNDEYKWLLKANLKCERARGFAFGSTLKNLVLIVRPEERRGVNGV